MDDAVARRGPLAPSLPDAVEQDGDEQREEDHEQLAELAHRLAEEPEPGHVVVQEEVELLERGLQALGQQQEDQRHPDEDQCRPAQLADRQHGCEQHEDRDEVAHPHDPGGVEVLGERQVLRLHPGPVGDEREDVGDLVLRLRPGPCRGVGEVGVRDRATSAQVAEGEGHQPPDVEQQCPGRRRKHPPEQPSERVPPEHEEDEDGQAEERPRIGHDDHRRVEGEEGRGQEGDAGPGRSDRPATGHPQGESGEQGDRADADDVQRVGQAGQEEAVEDGEGAGGHGCGLASDDRPRGIGGADGDEPVDEGVEEPLPHVLVAAEHPDELEHVELEAPGHGERSAARTAHGVVPRRRGLGQPSLADPWAHVARRDERPGDEPPAHDEAADEERGEVGPSCDEAVLRQLEEAGAVDHADAPRSRRRS